MLDALFRIVLFLLAFLLLLAVRKTRVYHRPTRRTNVPRSDSETCVWLQRLCDGVFDIFAVTFSKDACTAIQERVNAFLEDKGFASHADFRVTNIGTQPPRVAAIRVVSVTPPSTGGGGSSGSDGNGAKTSPSLGPMMAPSSSTHHHLPQHIFLSGSSILTHHMAVGGTLEIDVDVDYQGGASFELHAQVPIVRSRQLPIAISVSNVTFRVHCKLLLRAKDLSMEGKAAAASGANATDFGLDVHVQAMSEPDFSFDLHTSFTKYAITNFFGVCFAVKYVVLRLLRSTLLAGMAFHHIALPQQWSRYHPYWTTGAAVSRGGGPLLSAGGVRHSSLRGGLLDGIGGGGGVYGGGGGGASSAKDGAASDISSFVHSQSALPTQR